MRTRKDPEIRREIFIQAATRLFIEKGYEGVSVRSVLAAVGDKSASPSVFYYYFSSKDDLYHVCIETIAQKYVDGFRKQFSVKYVSLEDWMLSHITYMKDYLVNYLAAEKNIMQTGRSVQSQMFILDMREKVTKQVAVLWAGSFSGIESIPEGEAQKLSIFLAGGISEMIYSYMLEEYKDLETARELVRDMLRFSANTLGLSEKEKRSLLSRL